VALAAMAVCTQRVRLGPIVTLVAHRCPWKLGRETVSLDHLSCGRVTLGVGLGWGAARAGMASSRYAVPARIVGSSRTRFARFDLKWSAIGPAMIL